MENSATLQNGEMELIISRQKVVNDKLLRKYVIARTSNYGGLSAFFLLCFPLVLIGIMAHQLFGLEWPVIIAICSLFFVIGIYSLIISIPLNEGNLITTSIPNLQPTLLKYKTRGVIGGTILLSILTFLFLWLAFEVYYLFSDHFLGIEIDNRKGIIASGVVIIFMALIVILGFYTIYKTSKDIDNLVADIEECKLE